MQCHLLLVWPPKHFAYAYLMALFRHLGDSLLLERGEYLLRLHRHRHLQLFQKLKICKNVIQDEREVPVWARKKI